jgi:tetratricopeptide (TPR) repeat protein
MRFFCTFFLLLVATLPPGAASAAAGERDDFHLRPGNRWEYTIDDGGSETLFVSKIITIRGIPFAEMTRNGERPLYFLNMGNNLYRFEVIPGSGGPETVPTLLLKSPLEVGQSWISPWGPAPLSFTVLSEGDYPVPAGTFSRTLKIGYRPVSDPIYQGFIWYCPSVGIVAMENNHYRSELKSYTVSDLLPPEAVEGRFEDIAATLGISLETGAATPPDNRIKGERSSEIAKVINRLSIPMFLLAIFVSTLMIIIRLHRKIDLGDDASVHEGEITLASVMVKEGLYADAVKILQKLTEKHPQWPDLAALLGHAYQELGRTEDACLELKRALTLNQDMVPARLDLAAVYLSMDEPSRALDEVDAVLNKNPHFADALLLRGNVYMALGNPDKAAEDFRAALKINPSFTEARDQLSAIKDSGDLKSGS